MTSAAWTRAGVAVAADEQRIGEEPCATIDEARRRTAVWLGREDATDAEVELVARAYFAAWQRRQS